jgi:histidinol-phosphate/aromatic aminotransferase/cobyric acid decarboxylase-like protein
MDAFVNNRHGKVVDHPDDAAELAQAIKHFMNPENVQKASQAILADNLKQKVSINRVAQQLALLYESILQKKVKHPCMQCTCPQLS